MNDLVNDACVVLINQEEQFSLWPAGRPIPGGWREVFAGSHEACVDYVDRTWTDMRPRSLREQLAGVGTAG